jgi:methionine-rich copper-binding protein CopC
MRRVALLVLAAGSALALPAAAWAHAALLRTEPVASRTINKAPTEVRLTYSEPVEPRFAIVSVTDASGTQVTAGDPARAPGQPQTLVIALRQVPEGFRWAGTSFSGA